MHRGYRLLGVAVLLAGVLGLCVHYGATREAGWPYPSIEDVAENPGEYDGERALLIGPVRSVDPGSNSAVIGHRAEHTIEVRNLDQSVEPGGGLQVYGTIRDDGAAIVAERVIVLDSGGGERLYKLLTSALGGLLAAGAFLWFWRIDPRSLSFEVRRRG